MIPDGMPQQISEAAYHGDVGAIRLLLTRGASLDMLGPNLDLNGAVFHGHWELCEFLIEHGADVNYALPDTGETPLHSALCKTDPAFNRVLKALQLLLDAGAVRDAKDAHGDAPLSWASWHLRPRAILRMLCYGKYSVGGAE